MKSITVYIGLGGNEGDVLQRLKNAISLLSAQKDVRELKVSSFYRTPPYQADTIDWFVNAVCSFETTLSPLDLFGFTQEIETLLGKVPKPKNASRPIDIDILFYGNHVYHEKGLEIPHPHWKERLFVLIPLKDLTDKISIHTPNGIEKTNLNELIQSIQNQSVQDVLMVKNAGFQ